MRGCMYQCMDRHNNFLHHHNSCLPQQLIKGWKVSLLQTSVVAVGEWWHVMYSSSGRNSQRLCSTHFHQLLMSRSSSECRVDDKWLAVVNQMAFKTASRHDKPDGSGCCTILTSSVLFAKVKYDRQYVYCVKRSHCPLSSLCC